MANVFVSYARRDRERVLGVVSALEHEGLSVWWDPNLVPGKRFRDIIARELAAADSVVVVWTAASIQSDYVQDEAEEARERGVLVPITLEPVKPPAGFRQVQAADLSQWTGSNHHPEFRMLLSAVHTLVEAARAEEADAGGASSVAEDRASVATQAPISHASAPQTSSPPPLRPPPQTADPSPTSAGPTHPVGAHELHLLPRLFDLFARPAVWLTGAVLVALAGAKVGYGLSGTAAAMLVWAGAMAQAGLGFSPNRKMIVTVISLGVALIVGLSAHSPSGVVSAILVGSVVFAGVATIFVASRRGADRRRARDPARHEAYRDFVAEIERDVVDGYRRARGRSRRARSGAARDG